MNYRHPPQLEIPSSTVMHFDGEIGRRLRAVTDQWILPAPEANPAMLAMYRERDRIPLRQMEPWAGEFAGKYLTHAAQILGITQDRRIETHLRTFVRELISLQDTDGYLGPWPRSYRLGLSGPPPNCGWTWDTWGHYHVLLGLLKWFEITGDAEAFVCACRIADLLCASFLHTGRRIHETRWCEMNMAPYHALLLLYAHTGETRYFELAAEIELDFQIPMAGDYVRTALQGLEYHQTPKPRWESLHIIQGIAERYFITGEEQYRKAFEHLWWSMLRGDRHNNGGFSSGEQATGNPYDLRAIETCCTVAWTAMSVDMLRLSGNSIVADELELTLFNSGLGLMSPSGRWVTYDTPMEGRRVASAHSIVFQSRPGSPELNCCSVNGPRILGMLGDWALMRDHDNFRLNYYGPSTLHVTLPSGVTCQLQQVTDYPRDAQVHIHVNLSTPETFSLALRIPHWSEYTTVIVNNEIIPNVSAGCYLPLHRCWHPDDVIHITFDFRPHYWVQKPGYSYHDWETEWQVFAPFPQTSDDLKMNEDGALIIINGHTYTASKLRSVNGELDGYSLPSAPPGPDAIYCTTTVDSPTAALFPIRFSADFSTRILVNGQQVFQSESCGFEGDTTLRLSSTELPLHPGINRICLLISRIASRRPRRLLTIGCAELISEGENANDPSLHFTAIYRGPILLAFDHRFNTMDAEHIPVLDAGHLQAQVIAGNPPHSAWLLLECQDVDGHKLCLCDFASAGVTGNPYRTWFNVLGVKSEAFSPQHPLRSMRPVIAMEVSPIIGDSE